MSVCAAAPSPCLPLEKSANFVLKFRLIAETSNSRKVHPVSVTFRLFAYSAMCRNDGKAFRRQNVSAATFSAFRLHVTIGSGRLCGATRDSADRRPTLTAEKREKAIFAFSAIRSGRLENVLNVRYCGVPRGTPIICSTWNVDKLLSFNNLCKNVQNVRIIRSTYSDYKLLVISNLTF